MSPDAAQREADIGAELAESEPIGYRPVDSTGALSLRTGIPRFAFGLKLNESSCAVCDRFIGPMSYDDVFVWVACYAGPAGVVCEPCCAEIDPAAFLV